MPSRSLRDASRDSRSTSRGVKAAEADKWSSSKVGKEKPRQKTFMDHWVEPAVAEQPSYEDHHGLRYSVVEHMQPLGEAPNAKVKGRVRSDVPRKSVLGRSSAATGWDTPETPEGTPTPQPAQTAQGDDTTAQDDDTLLPPMVVVDDDKDEDYAPGGKKKERSTRSSTGKRHSEPAPRKAGADSRRSSTPSATKARKYDALKLKNVVEAAQKRARDAGKPDLATAVHEIWVESLDDTQLLDLLEAILTETATPLQTKEFQSYVRRAKKRLKEKSRNAPDGGANGTQGLPLRSPLKLPSSRPTEDHDSSAIPSTERTETSRPRLSLKVKSPHQDSKDHSSDRPALPEQKVADNYESDSSLTDLTEDDEDAMEMDEDDPLATRPSSEPSKANGVEGKSHLERNIKRSSADADFGDDEDERKIAAKKAKLDKTITRNYPYEESSIRGSITETAPGSRPSQAQDSSLVPPPLSLPPNGNRTASAGGSQAESADLDSPLSELSPPSSLMTTPPPAYRGRPKPPPGKRAKTKTSPEKKHQAGNGRLPGAYAAGRESPVEDDNEELSDNNDFCSACGGSGFLLCCDGCDRSFHFACLDPPLGENARELNEPWYCYKCVAKRPVSAAQPEKPPRGLFAPLLISLKKRNPTNFQLPRHVRDYYEGVHADKSGSFVEAVSGKSRGRPGYDEIPDYTKLKDAKGNTVICYFCGKSSLDHRQIIQCDYCGESWHLDCLDPPLANPPARTWDNKKLYDWMCPLHADQELRTVDTSLLLPPRRKVHLRRPRNAKVVETAFTRGFRNSGVIDVVDDDSDDSNSEFYEEETQDEGVVYRLPASGIKLDFIDKIKNTRIQEIKYERAYKRARVAAGAPSALLQANFSRRPFVEKQLALNLAQFAGANRDLNLGQSEVENLVGALIAEAPQEVVDEYMAEEGAEKAKSTASAIPPSPPSSEQPDQLSAEQRKELQLLQELIRRRLENNTT